MKVAVEIRADTDPPPLEYRLKDEAIAFIRRSPGHELPDFGTHKVVQATVELNPGLPGWDVVFALDRPLCGSTVFVFCLTEAEVQAA